jgi:hypothetical protein
MQNSLLSVAMVVLAAAAAGAPLFPEPIHVRRELHDPIAERTSIVDEYCVGNRIVTIQGARVVIADYSRREVIEIDHATTTFSITSFDQLPERQGLSELATFEPRTEQTTPSFDGRQLETYEFRRETASERLTISVSIDPRVRLSRDALDAVAGRPDSFAHRAAMRAAGASDGRRLQTDALPLFGLPADQTITYEIAGEQLQYRSTVVAIDRDEPPPELLLIPPGATRTESRLVAIPRMLLDLERAR